MWHRIHLGDTVLPVEPRLDTEKLHEKVHLGAPLARTRAWPIVAGLTVAFLLQEFGREPIETWLRVRFPQLCLTVGI